jgi:undecaprenyl-diphosphatase
MIMGAIQGITEFLPISSSAHLIVIPWLFKMNEANVDKIVYDVILHFGTAIALILVYAGKIVGICRNDFSAAKQGNFKDSLILKIAVGTIPVIVAGLLFKDIVETQLRTPYVVVVALVVVSFLMIVAERIRIGSHAIGYGYALFVGIAQAMALIPGVSRSGITITIAMFLGLRRSDAVDFTFLLSIPVVLGVFFYEARHISLSILDSGTLYLVGAISACFFGAMSLKFLIEYLKRHSLDVFAYYRIGLALLIISLIMYR